MSATFKIEGFKRLEDVSKPQNRFCCATINAQYNLNNFYIVK
jgi:hypothetical protein